MGTGHHRRQDVAADIPHLHIRDEGVEAHHARVNLAQRRGVQLDAQALELTRRRDVLAILPPPAAEEWNRMTWLMAPLRASCRTVWYAFLVVMRPLSAS
jgi:hypothetical protein